MKRPAIDPVRHALAGVLVLLHLPGPAAPDRGTGGWDERQWRTIQSLWIGNLGPPPPSPSNTHADDAAAAAFGARLFQDPRLSGNGQVACASCHEPQRHFTDGLPRARGLGPVPGHTMPLTGVAYSPWLFWNGRADSWRASWAA